jgi:Tfp pilus assembly protein PilP
MKKIIIVIIMIGLIFPVFQLSHAQQTENNQQAEINQEKKTTADILGKKMFIYDSEGRRDPFKDLLAGRDVSETAKREGISQMMIGDIVLIGIAEIKDNFTAIINGPQGFPLQLRVGTKVADGFVLSINDSKVVFRKTKERGVSMYRSKDITKEINPEER